MAPALKASEQMQAGTAEQRHGAQCSVNDHPAASEGDSSGRAERPSSVAGSARGATGRTGRSGTPQPSTPPLAASAPPALAYAVRLTPPDASRYLAEVWGIPRAVATLGKLRCTGGGPAFQKAGRNVVYPRASLDAWATAMLREGGDG